MKLKEREAADPANALSELRNILARTDDVAFLRMMWSIDAVQDQRAGKAARFLNYPKEAVTTDLSSKYIVPKWDIETLISVNLNTKKDRLVREPLDTREFNTVAHIVNLLRGIEDNETPGRVDSTNVLLELHRISHRQFAWQRGFGRSRDIYRYLYIYGQEGCGDFFKENYGVSVPDFFGVAFASFANQRNAPWKERFESLDFLNVSQEAIDRSLDLLAGTLWSVRRASQTLLAKFEESAGSTLPTIYQPSYLRIKPILRWDLGRRCLYIAPLPSLILFRATVGLYYDLQRGGTRITNEATQRFEQYARKSIVAHCPAFDAKPAMIYKHMGNQVETPDILLCRDGRIVAVFECKATKLTFEAQFGDDPIENAKSAYSQISKAIFQLWRFFSHVRRGVIDLDVAADAPAIVLTMDAWTQMSHQLRNAVISLAEEMVAAKEPSITDEDKRRPVFCPIQELDDMLIASNEEQLLGAFAAATEEKYRGWSIYRIREDAMPELASQKAFAFDPSELLPWWEMKKAGAA